VTPRWILSGPAVPLLVDDPIARRYLCGAKPFVIGRAEDAVTLPAEWEAIPVRSFTSYASLERTVSSGGIDPAVRAILYDCEAWDFTPEAEQRDHAGFTERAARVVHARGLTFITAPAVTLARLIPHPTKRRYDDFIAAGFAADAARHADAYVVQAQGSERDLPRFAGFVERAARQAREANPRVSVLAGISTNPSGLRVEANDILRAITATRGIVDGYWFNIPKPSAYAPRVNEFRPDIALVVFAALERAEQTPG
jgi:hypothetical protein